MGVSFRGTYKNLTTIKAGNVPAAASGLPVSGYSMWFDAQDTSSLTLSGSNVITWDDQTGNFQLTGQNTTPQYTTSDFSGQPSIAFNRNQWAQFDNTSFLIGTFFAVMRYDETLRLGDGNNFLIFCDSGGDFAFHGDEPGQQLVNNFAENEVQLADTFENNAGPVDAVNRNKWTSDYRVLAVRLDSVLDTTVNDKNVDNIGRDRTFHDFAGYLSELIVYPTLLTNSEVLEVGSSLGSKWGIF